MASGGMQCVKYTFVAFNVLFVICGCALLGLGLFLKFATGYSELDLNMGGFTVLMTEYFPFVLVAIGGLVVIISLIGCCGALFENQCLLCLYFFFIFLICLVEVAIGVLMLAFEDMSKESISTMFKSLVDDYDNGNNPTDAAVDTMQIYFKCCGESSYLDYSLLSHLPQSCCVTDAECSVLTGTHYEKGCTDAITENLLSYGYVYYALIGIAVLQLLGMIFSCCLCCSARRGSYDQPI